MGLADSPGNANVVDEPAALYAFQIRVRQNQEKTQRGC